MVSLGWQNGWKQGDENYQKIEKCYKEKHETESKGNGRGYTKYTCHTCGHYYEVDSSG